MMVMYPGEEYGISPADIVTWPSGTSDADKLEAIDFAVTLIEKILGRHFYVKAFDIEINGNDKNRITLPLYADIISISAVYICGIEISTSWYTWGENSVYLDLCASGASAAMFAQLAFLAGERVLRGLFPYGHNNCRFVGTFGEAVPAPIKEAIIWLVDANNEGTFGTGGAGTFKSEKIGDYSYTKGFGGDWKDAVFTGVDKVDAVLRHYRKQKKPIIMAP